MRKQFYKALRANGNRYGPRFSAASRRFGGIAIGYSPEITVPPRETESDARACRPLLLDVATQLLSAFSLEQGQTFVLRSIERVDIPDLPYPDRLWAHATWLPDADIQSVDQSAMCVSSMTRADTISNCLAFA